MRTMLIALLLSLALAANAAAPRSYAFDRTMPREVLDAYLSRSVTYAELLHGKGNFADNLRFLTNTGVKFCGRAIFCWGGESQLPARLANAAPLVRQIQAADPEMILQACAFEIVTRDVEKLAIPARVLREFGLPDASRSFRYEEMIYPPEIPGRNQWGREASIPDISRPETQLWFFHLAASYIDLGVEAIHFGQVEIMDRRDRDHAHWAALLGRVRRYAAAHARRHFVLCDAHVPSGGIVRSGQLLLDFHSFPLRVAEVPGQPLQGELRMGHLDTIFGRSKGGRTPSGWTCDHLPYLVELDNYGVSKRPGQPGTPYFTWGYDEICWFAQLPEAERNAWLEYAWKWVRDNDPNGWLQMPGSRPLEAPAKGRHWYWANTPSAATPNGFGQETTIKAIWAARP